MGTAGLLLHANPNWPNYNYFSPTTNTTFTSLRLCRISNHPLSLSNSNNRSCHHQGLVIRTLSCCSNSTSNSKPRGFGSRLQPPATDNKSGRETRDEKTQVSPSRKFSPQRSVTIPNELYGDNSEDTENHIQKAPGLGSQIGGKSTGISTDIQFEERLQAVQRLAIQQKRAEQEEQYRAIDYDAPIEPKSGSVGMGTKIGAGIAVVIFALVFAFGDFLPSGRDSPTEEAPKVDTRISSEERENLKKRLQQFEATLSVSPEDSAAIEGAAVTLTELGDYTRAATLLENLTKRKPSDPDVFRLLGEVKYQLKDYEGSAGAYRTCVTILKNLDFEVLRGLTNALLAAKKPDEAVQVLLASRQQINKEKAVTSSTEAEASSMGESFQIDPIQVDLLLGKAYSDWGHVRDAVSVYDQLISSYPYDFRAYLAKGIILKENGNVGDAERMFIQARFFAPDRAKALVDKYSR